MECEIVMLHPIIKIPFLLHFILQPIELQLGLIVCVDFMSPYDLCLSPFYCCFWKKKMLQIYILTTIILLKFAY